MSQNPGIQKLDEILRRHSAEELVPRFNEVERHIKTDGSIVTEADHAMQASVTAELSQHWPDIPLLGEEMTAEEHKALMEKSNGLIWILDPLDGTSNYASGLPYFAVSLALMDKGKVVLALVYDPLRDECFTAEAGKGAFLNGQPLRLADCDLPQLSKCLATVDFKRLDSDMAASIAAKPPYASQRSLGSVALDLCWLAAGRFHVYLHGRHQIWDYAAGHLIFAEAGGFATTLDGKPTDISQMQPRSTVAAGNAGLMQEWCDALGVKGVE